MNSHNVEILNATFTPMYEDGSINYDRIPDLFQHCVSTGANGIFLNGTTGECMSLSVEERLKLVETWTDYRKEIESSGFQNLRTRRKLQFVRNRTHGGTCRKLMVSMELLWWQHFTSNQKRWKNWWSNVNMLPLLQATLHFIITTYHS